MHSIEGLKKKILFGTLWLYLQQFLNVGLLMGQTIILARLLDPVHFGIIGVFLIISGALESFSNTGFHKALIQQKDISDESLNTAWTVSVVRGIILSSLILIFSEIFVNFLNAPEALNIVRILGLSFLLKGFYNTGTIYFLRDLDYFRQFLWKSLGTLFNVLVSIPLAFLLRNAWAIVYGILASDLAVLILSYFLHSYRPKIKFEYESFIKLFKFGKWIFLSGIIAFFVKQGDKIFITKLLGESLLGYYMVAWRFAKIPELLTNPLPNALFPAYSIYQDNKKFIKEKFIEILNIISLFGFPMIGGMIVLAKPIIVILIGEKWLPAAMSMQLLTGAMGMQIIISLSHSVFNAKGRTDFGFKMGLVGLVIISIFIYPLVNLYGLEGAAGCFLLLSTVRLIIWKIEIYKLINFSIRDMNLMILPISSTFIITWVIYFFSNIADYYNPYSFIGTVLASFLCYLIIILSVDKFLSLGLLHNATNIYNQIRNKN